jgi:hypothetical protein
MERAYTLAVQFFLIFREIASNLNNYTRQQRLSVRRGDWTAARMLPEGCVGQETWMP